MIWVILFDACLAVDYSGFNPPGICKQGEPLMFKTQTTKFVESDLYVSPLNDNNWWLTRLTME